jgi:hypothetical protein
MPFVAHRQVAVTNVELSANALNVPVACRMGGYVMLQAETQNVRYTMDGETHPSQSVGMILVAGNAPEMFTMEDFLRIRFIRGAGSDAVLNAHFGASRK